MAVKEIIELAGKTAAGEALHGASLRGLAEACETIGLKTTADSIRAGTAKIVESKTVKSIADGVASDNMKVVARFGPIQDPMQFPKELLDSGKYGFERTFGGSGASTHRLIPILPPPTPRIMAEDTVAISEQGGRLTGELLSFHKPVETGPLALIRLHNESSQAPLLDMSQLTQINSRLWRNESGFVYSSQKATASGMLPDASSLKFMPNTRALEPDQVKFVSGARSFPPEAQGFIDTNNMLIRQNASKPQSMLYALSSAPKVYFSDSPLVAWKTSSIFNPQGLSSNCMAATAAILRSLRTGTIVTAEDIPKLASKSGGLIGHPFVGRFENETQALDWFSEAGGVRIVNSVSHPSELTNGRSYALTVNLNPRSDSTTLHMAFAHRFEDGKSFFFDGQSGIQWDNKSIVKGKLPVRFHEVQFTG